jgi:ABC-type uncharacterized transport system ATPase subunit
MNALKPGVDATPVILAEDLTRRFGDFTAVDHIRVTVQPGEVFGLLGANGAGKTTAIRMRCGMLPPDGFGWPGWTWCGMPAARAARSATSRNGSPSTAI